MTERAHRGQGDDSFASLFEFLPIGAYRSLPDGRQLRANPALVRLNGFASEAEQLAEVSDIGAHWYVDPARRAEFQRLLMEHGHVVGFESEIQRYRSRERIWVRENAHVVRDADGQARYYEGTVEDITDRVQARENLQRSEENLRQVATHVPGALYRVVIPVGGQLQIDYISEGVRGLMGLEPADVMRDSGAIHRLRHPEDRDRVTETLERTNAAGVPLLTEYRVVLPEGQLKWIQQTSSPVAHRGDGALVRIGVMLDITERKRAESLLRASDARWKLALDSVGDGVWDSNLVTGERLLSRGGIAMFGFDEGDPEAQPDALDRRIHPDDLPHVLRARADHVAGRKSLYISEHRVQCKDGSWKWVLSRGTIIERDADGRPLRMVGTHTDISARKTADALRRQRDQAAAADLAKSHFLSRVSHELRTPLNAILGFTQLLEMELTGNERQVGWLRQVLASGRHLLGLMDDILDLSSAQTGQLRVETEPVDLRAVFDEVQAMLLPSAREAGVRVIDELPPSGGLDVRADRKRLRQVLANLVSNAIKYNRRGGWLRVTVEAADEGVRISVADSGIGFDDEQQARLFQPFERLGAQRGPVPGTGLGLALSRQLMEAMGGRIEARSRVGEGSVFSISLRRA